MNCVIIPDRAQCPTILRNLSTMRSTLQSRCYLELQKHSLTVSRKVQSNLDLYSRQLLQPLLQMLRAKLPVELRRIVYDHLMIDIDCTAPIVLPKPEVSDELHLFPQFYLFDDNVVGPDASAETQDMFVRKASFYYRGPLDGIDLDVLLDHSLPSGGHIRDLVRHLRVYVRYDFIPHEKGLNEQEKHLCEKVSYKAFATSLVPLSGITYRNRKVRIEICVLVTH